MRFVLLALLFAVTSVPALAADKPEPKYEGKPLDYWVERLQKAETDEARYAAANAIKAFGADAAPALPIFIEMLADHSESYRARVVGIIAAIGPKAKEARPVIVKRIQETRKKDYLSYGDAIEAIVAVSPEPKDALPDLIPLIGEDDWSNMALSAVCKMGSSAKDAIPAIRRYMLGQLAAVEKGKQGTLYGVSALAELGSDVAPLLAEILDAQSGHARNDVLNCLEKLGPDATKATPTLLKLLKKNDPATRFRIATVLWKIEKHPAAITACTELLKTDPRIKNEDPEQAGSGPSIVPSRPSLPLAYHVTEFLAEIGPDAKEALPQLHEAVAVGVACWFGTCNCEPLYDTYTGTRRTYRRKVADDDTTYKQQWNVHARIRLGEAALQAITKIETKPEK